MSGQSLFYREIGGEHSVDALGSALEPLLRGLFPGPAAERIGLAVHEAVINAIRHGNRGDPAATVRIAVTAEADQLVIRIADRGPGFDPDAVPDPRRPANRLRPHGRGLLLIRHAVDALGVEPLPGGGSELVLRTTINPS